MPPWPSSGLLTLQTLLLGVNDAFLPWYSEAASVVAYIDIVRALQALSSASLVAVCTSPPPVAL